jgi:hypothetical protein
MPRNWAAFYAPWWAARGKKRKRRKAPFPFLKKMGLETEKPRDTPQEMSTHFAEKARNEYGGERGKRAYDAIMAHRPTARGAAYLQRAWDPTHYADKALKEPGGGERAYDAIMALDVGSRHKAYEEKLWDPTHYADKALKDPGGGRSAYDAIMAQRPERRHLFYKGRRWAGTKSSKQNVAMPKPSVSDITFEKTPNNEKFWGCAISGDARASTGDRKSVEALCAENAACKGYYDGGPWFIATDTEPALCPTEKKSTW